MPKYFMRDTPLFAFEAMMMERPRSYRDYGAEEQQRPSKKNRPSKNRQSQVGRTADRRAGGVE